jgi:outer membrane biosynthesis protein TonB
MIMQLTSISFDQHLIEEMEKLDALEAAYYKAGKQEIEEEKKGEELDEKKEEKRPEKEEEQEKEAEEKEPEKKEPEEKEPEEKEPEKKPEEKEVEKEAEREREPENEEPAEALDLLTPGNQQFLSDLLGTKLVGTKLELEQDKVVRVVLVASEIAKLMKMLNIMQLRDSGTLVIQQQQHSITAATQ